MARKRAKSKARPRKLQIKSALSEWSLVSNRVASYTAVAGC